MAGPTATTPAWIAASLIFWGLFLIIFSLSTVRERLGGNLSSLLGKPIIARVAAWVGVLGYMVGTLAFLAADNKLFIDVYLGLAAFLVNRMWFGKAVNDFNVQVAQMGSGGPNVQADLSNGFTSTYLLLLSRF
jgi:hypothetical protein